jgi:DNA-binding MarR family transcriptional regulator
MRHQPLSFDPIAEAERHWREHGWEEAATGMAAVTSIMRAQQILLGRVDEVLRGFDLTFARFELLRLLAFSRKGTLPLGKISQRLQVHAASVTNAVDRLVAQGFVTRRPNPDDGRGLLASITRSGQEVVDQATEKLNTEVFGGLGLSERELQQLFRLLCKLRQSAGDF